MDNRSPDRSPSSGSLIDVFRRTAGEFGARTAVSDGDRRLTYAELDRLSDLYAARLARAGVRHGQRVGIYLDRSAEAVVAMLAVLKAGAAYLPFDPAAPPARRERQVRHAEVPVVLRRRGAPVGDWFAGLALDVDLRATDDEAGPPAVSAAPDDIAMVIYTSGSTNEPKGVEIRHAAVVNLIEGAAGYCEFRPDDVIAHTLSIGFDGATFEIWGALLTGAELAVAPPGWSLADLCALVEARGVTILMVTTGIFNAFGRSELRLLALHLRVLVTGGDVISPRSARLFLETGGRQLVNGYGPTETTTFSHCHVMTDAEAVEDPVPIGTPVRGASAYVLDADGRLIADGREGELFIGGAGVARSYLGDPVRTAERFVADPFIPGGRLYRTGDLGRRDAAGVFHFGGRIDGQVKINGFRIELSEIETALREAGALKDACVVRVGTSEGAYLSAFCVAETGVDVVNLDRTLKDRLSRTLPAYMIPRRLTVLPVLPLTLNGKVDRSALEAMALAGHAADGPAAPADADPLTASVLAILADLMPAAALSPTANLFEQGADSLTAMKFCGRLREAVGADLPLGAVFHAETVADLVEAAREVRDGRSPTAVHAVSL